MPLNANFDALSDGNLAGQDSWGGDSGLVVQGTVKQAGAKGVDGGATNNRYAVHVFPLAAYGSQVFYIRSSNVARDGYVIFGEGSTEKVYTWLWNYGSGAGKIGFNTSGSPVQVKTDAGADTFYKVEFEWRSSPSHQIRMRVNDGTWSDWYTPGTDWTSGLSFLRIGSGQQAAGHIYWDEFEDVTPPPSAVPRSFSVII